MRILEGRQGPAAEECGAEKAHRRVLAPKAVRGLFATMGPGRLSYVNTVGATGVASAGKNWGLIAIAAHSWALPLVDNRKFRLLLSPEEALVPSEHAISDARLLVVNFLLMIIG